MLDYYASLAAALGCPPNLRRALEKLIPGPQAAIALLCCGRKVTPREAAEALGGSPESVAAAMHDMYRAGILRRVRSSDSPTGDRPGPKAEVACDRAYTCNSLHTMVDEQLGRDFARGLDPDELEALRSYYYTGMLSKRDSALSQGLQSYSSQVIPHSRPHEAGSTVILPDDARAAVQRASDLVLALCSCRLTFRRCGHSLETCMFVDGTAREMMERGIGRRIGVQEAERVFSKAADEGLVLLAVLKPGDMVSAICSCCRCCCHDLRAFLEDGRTNWIAPSPYVAADDPSLCSQCHTCVERCVFGARSADEAGFVAYEPSRCMGCGVCVSACPSGAIRMIQR